MRTMQGGGMINCSAVRGALDTKTGRIYAGKCTSVMKPVYFVGMVSGEKEKETFEKETKSFKDFRKFILKYSKKRLCV
jgi:hypothetical protein